IATSDKDMAQIVSDRITLVDTLSGRRLDPEGVREKFGVPPEGIIDYLALVGDTSDNIPGIPGVGPKTAAKWLGQYGDLDNLRAHADEIPGKVGEKLRANMAALDLSRQLATVHCEVPLELAPQGLVAGDPDPEALRELYRRLEIRSLLRYAGDEDAEAAPPTGRRQETPAAPAQHYEIVSTAAELDRWIAKLESAELAALDTETTSLDYMRARLVGLSFAVTPGEAAYVPVGHEYVGAPRQLPLEETLERLRRWLESPEHPKVGHHLKYDAH